MSTSPPARVRAAVMPPNPAPITTTTGRFEFGCIANSSPAPPRADSGLAVRYCEEVLGGETRPAQSPLLRFWTLLIAAALSSGRHILQRYFPGPGAFGGLARMKNAAMTTRGTATILPAAKMVENDSPIRSRNGPMPNAATP